MIFAKNTFILLCLSLLLLIPFNKGNAQGTAELEYKPLPKSLLWEITGKGLRKPSYLYGTIHLIPKDSFFITDATKERMSEADELVLEVPIGDMGLGEVFSMMKYMNMPAGQSLKTVLSPKDYAYLDSFLTALPGSGGGGGLLSTSLSIEGINRIQPSMAMQQISSAYCKTEDEETPDRPLDESMMPEDGEDITSSLMGMSMGDNVVYELYFTDIFKESDRPVSGLETAKEQMKVLSSVPVEEQAASLMQAVRNPESLCGEMGDLVALYRSQDIQQMVDMSSEDEMMGDHLDNFLNKRNANWIPQIEEKVLAGDCIFIAVGAAHLAGPEGVIHLLRKAGYTLKPLF
ncbi:MAG: TraB/GumN family protein [Bacteroidia bacterium]